MINFNRFRKPKNISKIKKIKIDKIKSFTDSLTENQWNEWDIRQKIFNVHKNTKTYPLIWSFDIQNSSLIISKQNLNSKIWEILDPELKYLEKKYRGTVVKCMFAKLPANSTIDEHYDSSNTLILSHRFHLPIKTNNGVTFFINRSPYKLKEGFLYEFNNQLLHSVSNDSNEDRIHLIVDILPYSQNITLSHLNSY